MPSVCELKPLTLLEYFFIIVRRRKAENIEVRGVEVAVVTEAVEVVEHVEDVEDVEDVETIEAVMVMSKEEDLSIPLSCGIDGKELYASVINH